jgi:hypothetical protein
MDIVYCAGVLVALPDAKAGFGALVPLLKHEGRYFIWMYHPIDQRHHPHDKWKLKLYNWVRENITSPLPISVQHCLYVGVVPLYLAKKAFLYCIGGLKTPLTWREKVQALTDMFSPIYQHRFTEEEIVDWFLAKGFKNAETAYTERYGFGTRGDRLELSTRSPA